MGRGSEAGAAAAAAGPRRPRLALPWQRLREGPARGNGVSRGAPILPPAASSLQVTPTLRSAWLPSSPGAAGAPRGGPGARPGVQSCCHSFLDFSRAVFRLGSPRLRGGRANWQPKPWAEFLGTGRPAAREGKLSPGPEPCSVLCRVHCARLQRRLRRPLGTVASFLALGSEAGRGRLGGGAAYTGPGSRQSSSASLALSLRAPNPPISLAVVDGAQRDPAAAAAGAASSITRRMPSGRALPAAPAASQPPTGPETPYIHTALGKGAGVCSALLPVPPPAPGSSGQRGIQAEKTPAAAAAAERKRRPGGCSYAPLLTPSGCNALGPASARLLPARAGLVRAAVCRCGSSPSPRRPPPRSAQLPPPP